MLTGVAMGTSRKPPRVAHNRSGTYVRGIKVSDQARISIGPCSFSPVGSWWPARPSLRGWGRPLRLGILGGGLGVEVRANAGVVCN